jgi:hypothetical protein
MEQNNKRDNLLLIINIVAWTIVTVGGYVTVSGIQNYIEGGDVFDGFMGIPIAIIGGIILFLGFRLFRRKRF